MPGGQVSEWCGPGVGRPRVFIIHGAPWQVRSPLRAYRPESPTATRLHRRRRPGAPALCLHPRDPPRKITAETFNPLPLPRVIEFSCKTSVRPSPRFARTPTRPPARHSRVPPVNPPNSLPWFSSGFPSFFFWFFHVVVHADPPGRFHAPAATAKTANADTVRALFGGFFIFTFFYSSSPPHNHQRNRSGARKIFLGLSSPFL